MMHEMMDLNVWQERREEIVREAQQNRLPKALRAGRKTRGGWLYLLTWELRRGAGLLLKFSRRLNEAEKEKEHDMLLA